MKLRCKQHNQRVHVLNANTVVHRSDGKHCNSELAIGSFRGYAVDVMVHSYIKSK